METKVKAFNKKTNLTKPQRDEFWDHTDGEYDRKFIPGGVIWQYQYTGEITLKFDINDEITQKKFTSIYGILYNLTENSSQMIPPQPTTIVLQKDIHYQLNIFGKLIEEGNRIDETWNIEFLPNEKDIIPPN